MKNKTPNVVDVNSTPINRRIALKSFAFSGASLSLLPSSWTKPMVNSVLLPAHAQTSVIEVEPEVECQVLSVGNGTFSAGSAPGTCGLSFEFVSGDATTPLNVISIANTTPVGTDQVTYSSGTSGSVTASGLGVVWLGQAVGAPFACAADAPVPINDVTFTVTFNCADNPAVQTMTFSLLAVAASL